MDSTNALPFREVILHDSHFFENSFYFALLAGKGGSDGHRVQNANVEKNRCLELRPWPRSSRSKDSFQS